MDIVDPEKDGKSKVIIV